jgi:2-aminoadipate transaminase
MLEATVARRAAHLARPAHADGGSAISFDSGYAFPGTLPDLSAAAERALGAYRREALQYGPRFGLPDMREWIATLMCDDGANVVPGDVLVTNGAKHGIELFCRLFTEEGDTIVVSAPTYFTAIPIFRSFGLGFVEVAQDGEGIEVDTLRQQLHERERQGLEPPKFIYNVTDFHNPSGITMSRRRREALVALATERQIPVLEDSPYRKLRFEGQQEPSLKSLDSAGVVFALGTVSKIMAPGLRIGWVAGPRPLIARMGQLKSDGGTCPLTQRVVLEFSKGGGLVPHLRRVTQTYADNRDRMVAAVRRELPDVTLAIPQGGYYLWLHFPAGTDTDALAERAHDAGVSVIGGSAFFAGESVCLLRDQRRYMRLAFSHATHVEIDEGVRRLAAAYGSSRT